ncbi:MAG TPA: SDR family NAD(P)-dependent oxidoreductase [Thermodesulfovibrionales bacterium]|nr:SDR family NAD(P)-dependent oxidoreductase [Thermodesulfovibrionales bacterium]
MKTVLVTGCAGFIGSVVSKKLLESGQAVLGIDSMNDYYDPRLKEWRLQGLSGFGRFAFHKMDIADYDRLRNITEPETVVKALGGPLDAVVNLAARAGVRASVADPWAYLDTNTKGTLNLLECCKEYGIRKFVLASTSSIYGLNEMPFRETANTDHPLAPYSATKKAAEAMCFTYHFLHGIDISIPRYFTVYGPWGRPDMSIFRFIRKIDTGKAIPVFGDGKQERDFTYIDDIAEGTLKCLQPFGYELFNLGNDSPSKLMHVIKLIEENLGRKATIEWLERHPADTPASWANIEKSRNMLKWAPTVSIEEGVRNTVQWYRENREFLLKLKE